MKRILLLFCFVLCIVCLGVGINNASYANSLTPSSLLDINTLPAVATDSNDNVTITWGYFGLAHLPGILAKQYYADGTPIDNTEFWVSPAYAEPSLFSYGPDIATDSANNAVITWCSYVFSSPGKNIGIAYTKLGSPTLTGMSDGEDQLTTIAPHQEEEDQGIDFASGENGIYLVTINAEGTAIEPVKIVDNSAEST
jgi:hypothetical protein